MFESSVQLLVCTASDYLGMDDHVAGQHVCIFENSCTVVRKK